MNKYRYFYLIWIIPALLLFLCVQQGVVHFSLIKTYQNGKSYSAEILNMKVKKIATQTTGHIRLRFDPQNGPQVNRKMSLPIEMAPEVSRMDVVPIRYRKGAYEDIVLMPAYKVQKDLIWTNFLVGLITFLIALTAAMFVTRFANKKAGMQEKKLKIKRVG